uniref:Uncharacterized protein n=1 Tax=Arundo donax TaxID=35708 RepID=A0A0A9BH11_ARUDO
MFTRTNASEYPKPRQSLMFTRTNASEFILPQSSL